MTLYWPGGPLVWLLTSFVVTVVVLRFVTAWIRAGRGRFSDVAVGALHIHHMVWGVGLVLLCGTVALAFRPVWPFDVAPAIGFGAGAALMLDEFALILYVRDVYWAEEGRLSLAAMVVMAVAVGMVALPLGHLPAESLPVVAGLVTVYVAFTGVCLAKGKVLTSLAGLFVAPVVLYGGLRLARPDSPWARRRYGPEKLRRAQERYAHRVVRERRRQRLLELISGTDIRDPQAH
jgi:hypothetical protein